MSWRLPAFLIALAGLPLAGAWWVGTDLRELFSYPPPAPDLVPPPSPAAYVAGALGLGILFWWARRNRGRNDAHGWPRPSLFQTAFRLPAWGWAAAAWTILWWVLAWTRMPWFAWAQPYTFTPLWLGYIAMANAKIEAAGGRALWRADPKRFFLLFPASAAFWWGFEYLNRFTQNWIYPGLDHTGPLEYAIHGSICFSTVLPAVASTAGLINAAFGLRDRPDTPRPAAPNPRQRAWCAATGTTGLLLLGSHPLFTFPLVWIAPGLLWLGLAPQTALERLWTGLPAGNGARPLRWALAALICGFFWEMWNFGSLETWEYRIPWFGAFPIFEMPVAGYLGYLPFGVICGLAMDALWKDNPG